MGTCVDHVCESYGKEITAPYKSMRNTVTVQGVVLYHPKCPPLRASIVLDQNSWTRDDGESVLIRTYLITHEIEHVLQNARETDPIQRYNWDPSNVTHAERVQRLAAALRDEFIVDINALSQCKKILRSGKDKTILPSQIMGPRFVGSAHQLLKKLCDFAKRDLQTYRETSVGLDELYPRVAPLIGELFSVLTHSAAIYTHDNRMNIFRSGMEEAPEFTGYLAEDLEDFLLALVNNDSVTAELEIVRILEVVLGYTGLRIEDLPDGNLYIHVHAPVIC
ncbi:MAG: hypothetical protein Q7J27_13605 [Syntrophales bacterium]|nr:hypothetical protein [Syntrophales bacterium]